MESRSQEGEWGRERPSGKKTGVGLYGMHGGTRRSVVLTTMGFESQERFIPKRIRLSWWVVLGPQSIVVGRLLD